MQIVSLGDPIFRSYLLEKIKKNISLSSVEFAHSMVSDNLSQVDLKWLVSQRLSLFFFLDNH